MKFALGLDMHKDSIAYALITKEGKIQQQGDIKQSQNKNQGYPPLINKKTAPSH